MCSAKYVLFILSGCVGVACSCFGGAGKTHENSPLIENYFLNRIPPFNQVIPISLVWQHINNARIYLIIYNVFLMSLWKLLIIQIVQVQCLYLHKDVQIICISGKFTLIYFSALLFYWMRQHLFAVTPVSQSVSGSLIVSEIAIASTELVSLLNKYVGT